MSRTQKIIELLRAELADEQQALAKDTATKLELTQCIAERKQRVRNLEKQLATFDPDRSTKRVNGSKPAPKKQDVVDLITQLLGDGPLQENDLRASVDRLNAQAGRSRMGLKMRFNEALALPQFRESADGYSLLALEREDK